MDGCWNSLQSSLLQFILYTWLEITIPSTNSTMSLLHLINLHCFPKDFRIMLYCEKLSWSGPTYIWGLVVSYHICITSVTSRTLLSFQESHAIVTLHVYHVISPPPPNSPPLACGCLANSTYPLKLNTALSLPKAFSDHPPRMDLFSPRSLSFLLQEPIV